MLFKELPDMEGIEMKLSELHYIQLLDEARQEILTKGNNTVHYLKEIESRLSDGEEAAKKLVGLEKEVENLQCCGNCKYFMYCKTDGLIYCEIEVFPFPIKGMCNQWQSDGLTQEERIKG